MRAPRLPSASGGARLTERQHFHRPKGSVTQGAAMGGPFDLKPLQAWATPFYQRLWAEHPAEAPSIIAHLYDLKARSTARIASGVAPAAKSPAGLFESEFDLFADPHPGIAKFVALATETVQAAVSHVNGSRMEPARLKVNFPDSWFHITTDGGFHDAHYHGGCSWCGIYYLQAGEAGRGPDRSAPNGGNRFYSPLAAGGGYTDYGNKYLDLPYIDPPPKDGLLILFPSYLLHSALPYRGTQDRIVISFNSRAVPA
jgi:uncharacterized protein (TIGR02466 family)